MTEVRKKSNAPRKGLGRGLDALLGDALREDDGESLAPAATQVSDKHGEKVESALRQIAVANIEPNPNQPRRQFDPGALEELSDSIKRHGVVQPVVLRPQGEGYQIVAGERRWRAAQKAQLHQVPAIIRDYSDEETLEIALLENIQRKDLNPIEEAEAYQRLSDEFGHTQAALAKIVNKSRSHVANMMRLLDLSAPLRDLVQEGKLSMGHARALLPAPDALQLAALVVKKRLSVRQTEALVKKQAKGGGANSPSGTVRQDSNPADIQAVEAHLGDLLGLKVSITTRKNGKAGAVTFDYNSLDQLDMLCHRLTGGSF